MSVTWMELFYLDRTVAPASTMPSRWNILSGLAQQVPLCAGTLIVPPEQCNHAALGARRNRGLTAVVRVDIS